jgi:hypothetical protein
VAIAARAAAEFHTALHARDEPARRHGVIDAGGGFQNYPDDYAVIERLHAEAR